MTRTPIPTGGTLRAGLIASVVSGIPSTIHALAAGRDPLEATVAAGSMVLGEDRPHGHLLLAGLPTHVVISVIWAFLITANLPRTRRPLAGVAYGLGIAAIDLGFVGRAFPRIRALPVRPQIADHVAFGLVVAVLTRPDPDA